MVDEVAMQVCVDQLACFGLHPCGHERGQVPLGVAVKDNLIVDQAQGVLSRHARLRQRLVGDVLDDEPVAEPARKALDIVFRHHRTP